MAISEAAIRLDDKVYTGDRHDDIRKDAAKYGLASGALDIAEHGFVTTDGEFVDRVRAAEIAFEFKQIRKRVDALTTGDLGIYPMSYGL